MSQPNDVPNPFDPFSFWRTTQNASLDAWSKAMIELVNTDAYAQATGRILDTYLAASVPMRKAIEQAMAQVLSRVNMPTRAEVLSIAERMTNIEMRLDDLDARFDEIQRMLAQVLATTAQASTAHTSAVAAKTQTKTTSAPAAGSARPSRGRTSSTSARPKVAAKPRE